MQEDSWGQLRTWQSGKSAKKWKTDMFYRVNIPQLLRYQKKNSAEASSLSWSVEFSSLYSPMSASSLLRSFLYICPTPKILRKIRNFFVWMTHSFLIHLSRLTGSLLDTLQCEFCASNASNDRFVRAFKKTPYFCQLWGTRPILESTKKRGPFVFFRVNIHCILRFRKKNPA